MKKLDTVILLFGGFFVSFLVFLRGGDPFYIVLVVAIVVLLITRIWDMLKPKIAVAVVYVMIASVVGFPINKAYHNSFERVNEGVNLNRYDPFRENTLAASLDKPSTLSLKDNLPRLDGATALYPVY